MNDLRAIGQLVLCHIRGFWREPEAIFWTYGFPLLMIVSLGIAFDSTSPPPILVDVVEEQGSEAIASALLGMDRFKVHVGTETEVLQRLRRNKTSIVVREGTNGGFEYHFDPTNPDARVARSAVDDALQRAAGRTDVRAIVEEKVDAPGSRYVDFLVPGLIGMNLMGGGLWGIGFTLVDMRIKKLLKRLLGTPMKRPHLLVSMIGTRVLFFIPEVFVLLLVAKLIFGIPIAGSVPVIVAIAFVGCITFCGLGLLAASRAQRIESITGIMNVIMLPMWLCSGVFFSVERFPDVMQPFIHALPLTQLIIALRAVILEGQGLISQSMPLLILMAWGGISFLLAMKWFRWN